MKADISHSGVLTVTAETEVESFALARWSELYFCPIEHSSAAFTPLLVIDTTEVIK